MARSTTRSWKRSLGEQYTPRGGEPATDDGSGEDEADWYDAAAAASAALSAGDTRETLRAEEGAAPPAAPWVPAEARSATDKGTTGALVLKMPRLMAPSSEPAV